MDTFIYRNDKNHAASNDIKNRLPMQNTSVLMFMLVFWNKELLLTEQSYLGAACQGIEEVKKYKTGKSHCCGSRIYATFWILKEHV